MTPSHDDLLMVARKRHSRAVRYLLKQIGDHLDEARPAELGDLRDGLIETLADLSGRSAEEVDREIGRFYPDK